jgi:hypothetical protein
MRIAIKIQRTWRTTRADIDLEKGASPGDRVKGSQSWNKKTNLMVVMRAERLVDPQQERGKTLRRALLRYAATLGHYETEEKPGRFPHLPS